ncbi:MAG: HAMP domain-containing histidine kinase [Deltaproteobacteria bacterium]|nr:HAMP domain-containing histidine kinase [Deltaproteobacteria bacterium]
MTRERALRFGSLVRGSLFFKLVLIYLGTTVVLMLTVGMVFHLTFDRPPMNETPLGKHLQKYVEHLANELGDPPQRDRGLRLAQELGVQSHVTTPQGEWTTIAGFPSDATLTAENPEHHHLRPFGRYHDAFFATLDRQDVHYTFLFPRESFGRGGGRAVIWLLTLIGVVLGGSYLVVRWLFRPLSWLNVGVREIAKGNLTYQVPVRSADELGRLTESFNVMATQVRDIVRAREQLLMDVSHELRSPLTRLKVGLEFVQDKTVRARLQQEARELETMVTELLEAERLSSDYGGVRTTEADLVALVRDVVGAYRERQPTIRVIATLDSLLVHMDVERVRIALRNILENALTYSPATGPPVEVRVQRTDASTLVSVRDHGPGISPEEQGRVFEPFYRVDKSRERGTGGYGLGLSLAKKIMTAHRGDLLLVSALGQGSTFTLQFPL